MQTGFYNYPVIARMLIKHGADVNLRGTDGSTIISRIEASTYISKRRKRVIKIFEDAGGVR